VLFQGFDDFVFVGAGGDEFYYSEGHNEMMCSISVKRRKEEKLRIRERRRKEAAFQTGCRIFWISFALKGRFHFW